jgi:hypothetical protein
LNVRNASIKNSRCKTGQVADNAPAERDEERRSVEASLNHGIADRSKLRERFRGLASGNRNANGLEASVTERTLDGLSVKRSDIGIGHHYTAAGF